MLILLTDKVFCGCMRSIVQKCRVPSLLTDTYLPAPLLSVVSSVPCDTLGRCVIRVIVSRWQLKQRIVIQLQTWKFFSKINQLFFYDIIRDAFCSLDVSTLNSSPVPHFSTPRYSYEIPTFAVYEIKTIEYDIVDVNVSRKSLLIIFPATPKTGVIWETHFYFFLIVV